MGNEKKKKNINFVVLASTVSLFWFTYSRTFK